MGRNRSQEKNDLELYLQQKLKVHSFREVQKKTVRVTVTHEQQKYLVEITGRKPNGDWAIQNGFKCTIKSDDGLYKVAEVIVEELAKLGVKPRWEI